ncbi:LON peptidase substrate-binding domain-containing protein [Phaeovulum sp.]|uniref:LON peptidase substrate-binding domain-containing protein n=1 Tax=Phaeovulum sp. TaxID=2934796 RepID=UPI00356B28F4
MIFKTGDLPETLPLFPLPGALLLPRARLPLQLFEPRYLQMLEDSLKTRNRLIGMIQPRSGAASGQLNTVGCAGRVTSFLETDDGRYMVTLSGISRFRLVNEVPGFTPYRRGEVDWADFASDLRRADPDESFQRGPFLELLRRFFAAAELSTDWDTLKDAENELLIDSLSMLLPLAPEDKQALLEAPNLQARRETLETLLEFALRSGGMGGGGGNEDMLQ